MVPNSTNAINYPSVVPPSFKRPGTILPPMGRNTHGKPCSEANEGGTFKSDWVVDRILRHLQICHLRVRFQAAAKAGALHKVKCSSNNLIGIVVVVLGRPDSSTCWTCQSPAHACKGVGPDKRCCSPDAASEPLDGVSAVSIPNSLMTAPTDHRLEHHGPFYMCINMQSIFGSNVFDSMIAIALRCWLRMHIYYYCRARC